MCHYCLVQFSVMQQSFACIPDTTDNVGTYLLLKKHGVDGLPTGQDHHGESHGHRHHKSHSNHLRYQIGWEVHKNVSGNVLCETDVAKETHLAQRKGNKRVWGKVLFGCVTPSGGSRVCFFCSRWCRKWWRHWELSWKWCSCVWQTARPGYRRLGAPACKRQVGQQQNCVLCHRWKHNCCCMHLTNRPSNTQMLQRAMRRHKCANFGNCSGFLLYSHTDVHLCPINLIWNLASVSKCYWHIPHAHSFLQ